MAIKTVETVINSNFKVNGKTTLKDTALDGSLEVGKDLEVDGKLALNSAEDLNFKDGSSLSSSPGPGGYDIQLIQNVSDITGVDFYDYRGNGTVLDAHNFGSNIVAMEVASDSFTDIFPNGFCGMLFDITSNELVSNEYSGGALTKGHTYILLSDIDGQELVI